MPSPDGAPAPQRRVVDLKFDLAGPVAPGDSAIFMVGNFAAQHNGAVITCDSAVRYSDMRIEFFGNVLINKNTTYIYGDRAEYDGTVNEARIYSDLIKVVDGDAVLYTYRFAFDTRENIGRFEGGGVLVNRENLLEATRGYYYADLRELVGVEQVELRNDEYELRGDSVVYNMESDNAEFFERTNIWNRDGDYLYADRGFFFKRDTLYRVTRNGYILTEKQELWSDSIDYYRTRGHALLRHDIQIDDTDHKVLAFGDYGEVWNDPGDALLTRRPAVVSYDLEQGPDTLYMRSDTIRLHTLRTGEEPAPDAADEPAGRPGEAAPSADAAAPSGDPSGRGLSSAPGEERARRPHTPAGAGIPEETAAPDEPAAMDAASDEAAADDDAAGAADSLAAPQPDTVALTAAQRKAAQREEARRAKAERQRLKSAARKEQLTRIAAERRARANAKLTKQKEREEARLKARRLKTEAKLQVRRLKALRKGRPLPTDEPLIALDSLIAANTRELDSLYRVLADSLERADSTTRALLAADTVTAPPADSIYRLVKGFHAVRIYRSDFQAVCDSMTAISTDSTLHLYIDPVLWNGRNQITSEVMDIYTRNQQLQRAEFVGEPLMVGQVDTAHYNQIKGKQMICYFSDNKIYRNDVIGNAQTLYYHEDGEPAEAVMFNLIESADLSIYIENNEVYQITWRTNPDGKFYPMDKIPADQELYLRGFKWEEPRRPQSKEEILDRRIRPSERVQRSALQRPSFPIRSRIEAYRKRLVESRRWTDRNDEVDVLTTEWMRSLGYEPGQPHPRRSGPAAPMEEPVAMPAADRSAEQPGQE